TFSGSARLSSTLKKSKVWRPTRHVCLATSQATMGTPTTVTPTAPDSSAEPKQRTFGVPQLIAAMLKSGGHISVLIFSPGRAPQGAISGQLVELKFKGLELLKPEDTRAIAHELMGKNEHPIHKLEQDGSAD